MEKEEVFIMFYPIDWERYIFEGMPKDEIIKFVKEHGINDVKFVTWNDMVDWDWVDYDWDELYYYIDLFNDWDDTEDEDVEKECREMCECLKLDEKMVKDHWCYPVTKSMKDAILKTN